MTQVVIVFANKPRLRNHRLPTALFRPVGNLLAQTLPNFLAQYPERIRSENILTQGPSAELTISVCSHHMKVQIL